MANVLIIEPTHTGHRLYYVALLVDEARKRGDVVRVVTTIAAQGSDEWATHLRQRVAADEVLIVDAPVQLPSIAHIAREVDASVTVVPDGDAFLGVIIKEGWRGEGSLNLLAMRPDAQSGGGWIRRGGISVVKRARVVVAGWRRGVRTYALRSPLTERGWPVRWVADPVTVSASMADIDEVRKELRAAAPGRWAAVVGAITERKNLDLIARSIIGMKGLNLLVAGEMDAGAFANAERDLAELRGSGASVLIWNGTLDETKFDAVIGAVDCVVAAHSNEGPSGVVGKAAVMGTYLVMAGAASLREDARTLGPERARWCRLDSSELRDSMELALGRPSPSVLPDLDSREFARALLGTPPHF